MKKNYNIYEVTKTFFVEVDKETNADNICFDFTVAVIQLNHDEYAVQVYRSELLEMKALSGEISHDAVLVRDFFLVDDRLRFKSEADASAFIRKRLNELFD